MLWIAVTAGLAISFICGVFAAKQLSSEFHTIEDDFEDEITSIRDKLKK